MIISNFKKLFIIYNLCLLNKKVDFINNKKFYLLLWSYYLNKFYKNMNFLFYLNLINLNKILIKKSLWFNFIKKFNILKIISVLKFYKIYIKSIKNLIFGYFFSHYLSNSFEIYQNIFINKTIDFKKNLKFF